MLNWFTRRTSEVRNAHEIYGSIVTMTRMPALYDQIGVDDTLEKRFESLMLHMFLVLNWLNRTEDKNKKLKQALVDRFFEDTETISRQAGVGDLAVPKKMRQLAAVFAARMEDYRAASNGTDNKPLEKLLSEIFFKGDPARKTKSATLAQYMRKLEDRLASQPPDGTMADLDDVALFECTPHE